MAQQPQTVSAPGLQARRGGFADDASQPKRARKAVQPMPAATLGPASETAAPALSSVGPVWWWWQ
jgi:hypothetical protein